MAARIRLAVFSAFIVFFVAVMGLLCLPLILFGRNVARSVVKLWAKLGLFCLKIIAGVSYRVEGVENIPQEGAIIAANHQSMWETIALYAIAPKPVMVFKKELLKIPVYGWWAKYAGNLCVDRKGGSKAMRTLIRAARERIEAGEQVIIFPEGTRTAPDARTRYQPGVAGVYVGAQAPCVPAVHDSGRYWRHHAREMVPGVITLRFLPAIPPGLASKAFLAELEMRIDNARPDRTPAPEGVSQ